MNYSIGDYILGLTPPEEDKFLNEIKANYYLYDIRQAGQLNVICEGQISKTKKYDNILKLVKKHKITDNGIIVESNKDFLETKVIAEMIKKHS